MDDLVSLVLTLRPLAVTEQPEGKPPWLGRAAQALFLRAIAGVDEALASALHEDPPSASPQAANPVRPYTVSTLMGHFVKGLPDPQTTYTLRLTAFRQDVAQALLTATQTGGALAPGQTVELDYLPFVVEAIQPFSSHDSPWAMITNYQAISASLWTAEPAPRRLRFQWTSPTTFKSGGRHVPLPQPELVFGSLLERWNGCSPISFPAETKRYAAECLAVSQYDLKTVPVPQKGGGLRVGAVGSVTFTTLNYDRYWMSVLTVLARFSLFCGLGVGTAQGLGQVRLVVED